jgi:excisionase family DNA binding protein
VSRDTPGQEQAGGEALVTAREPVSEARLQHKARSSAASTDGDDARSELPPEILTVDELAALLLVNRKTVYEALARAEIPGARRIGGRYRILPDAVIDWLASSQDRVADGLRNFSPN